MAAVDPTKDAPPRPVTEKAKALKGVRYTLWKNPEHLGEHHQSKLAWIAKTERRLYPLKEGLPALFQMNLTERPKP